MESVKVKSGFMICLVLSLLAGRSAGQAIIAACYVGCVGICTFTGNPPLECAAKCVKDCLLAPLPLDNNPKNNKQYFCKLGCATSLCTKFTTKQDPAEKKVVSCVNSCAQTCAN